MLARRIPLFTRGSLIKVLVVACFFLNFSKIAMSQNSAKYNGGSYDGFSLSFYSLNGLNGLHPDTIKYTGESYDGFAISNISLTGLNGQSADANKFLGGSFDGFTLSAINQTGLNGQSTDLTKFKGGSYDGFAIFSLLQTGLNGQSVDFSKYKGAGYDGFALNNISLTGLNGQLLDLVKYHGASFDGFAFNNINMTGLNGQFADLVKYKGGSFDGFTVSGTQLIPLNGGNMRLRLGALIEGFYNPVNNKMIKDTVMVYLRISNDPRYSLVDSAKAVVDSAGFVNIDFQNAQGGSYYIVIKHRNSIETWSMSGQSMAGGGVLNIYDFTLSQSNAYGNNMVLKGTRYCIFSGDVNQDGVIDGADLALIDNDVSNFVSGYVSTDVNGDQVIDGSDLSIADNNVSNFISVQAPPGAPSLIKVNGSKIKKLKRKK